MITLKSMITTQGGERMRHGGRPSWQVVIEEPPELHLVLFVRDAFGLAVRDPSDGTGGPGPLVPDVPDLRALLDDDARAGAATAWPAWWRAALDGRRGRRGPGERPADIGPPPAPYADAPDFPSLAPVPPLRAAARVAFRPFLQWWSAPWDGPASGGRRRDGWIDLPGAEGRLVNLHAPSRRTEQDVVARLERELGRHVRPFEYRVGVLAVEEPDVVLAEGRSAVVSGRLLGSADRYAEWLHDVLLPHA